MNKVIITQNSTNKTVEFERVNGIEVLEAKVFPNGFEVVWRPSIDVTVFSVFAGENNFVIAYREIDPLVYTSPLLFYNYLKNLADYSQGGGGGGGGGNVFVTNNTNPSTGDKQDQQNVFLVNSNTNEGTIIAEQLKHTIELEKVNEYLVVKDVGTSFDLNSNPDFVPNGFPVTFNGTDALQLDFGSNFTYSSTKKCEDITELVAELNAIQDDLFFEVGGSTTLVLRDKNQLVYDLANVMFSFTFEDLEYSSPYDITFPISNLDVIKEKVNLIEKISLDQLNVLNAINGSKNHPFTINNGLNDPIYPTVGTEYLVFLLRLKSGAFSLFIDEFETLMDATTNDKYILRVGMLKEFNHVFIDANFQEVDPSSKLEYARPGVLGVPNLVFSSSFFAGGRDAVYEFGLGNFREKFETRNQLPLIEGVHTISITVEPRSANLKLNTGLNWSEQV